MCQCCANHDLLAFNKIQEKLANFWKKNKELYQNDI